jgi:hypothetical protein
VEVINIEPEDEVLIKLGYQNDRVHTIQHVFILAGIYINYFSLIIYQGIVEGEINVIYRWGFGEVTDGRGSNTRPNN